MYNKSKKCGLLLVFLSWYNSNPTEKRSDIALSTTLWEEWMQAQVAPLSGRIRAMPLLACGLNITNKDLGSTQLFAIWWISWRQEVLEKKKRRKKRKLEEGAYMHICIIADLAQCRFWPDGPVKLQPLRFAHPPTPCHYTLTTGQLKCYVTLFFCLITIISWQKHQQ